MARPLTPREVFLARVNGVTENLTAARIRGQLHRLIAYVKAAVTASSSGR